MPAKTKTTSRARPAPQKKKGRIIKKIGKLKNAKQTEPQNKNTVTENRLELLVTIVNRSKGEYYADLLQAFDVNMQFVALGHGTADAKILSRFGLTDSDKTVIFSVIQGNMINDALGMLEHRFNSIKNGKGIAYTIPLSSVIGTLIFGFLSNNRKAVKEDKNG